MGIKKEWKNLKKGYKTLQKKARENQAKMEEKNLQKLKDERKRQEVRASRVNKLMQERARINKAKATIRKSRGQSSFSKTARGVSKATNWLFVDATPNRKAPIKRSVSKGSPKYVVRGGVAYPMAKKKIIRSKPKPKPKKPSFETFYEDWKKPLY